MPQALFIPITVSAANVAVATALATIWNSLIVNLALGAISKALVKKPRVHIPPINVTVRNVIENRRIVFGTIRAGGSFVYYTTTNSPGNIDAKYLWYVIALAGHQIADIKDVWLDTRLVVDSIINGGAAEGGAVTTGDFANKLWIYKHLGTSTQSVDAELNSALGSSWDASHKLYGIAYIVAKMERDDAKYPQGAPQNVTALVDGALLYDPRLDSTNGGSGSHRRNDPTTWEFGTIGRNPALQWRWYVAGGSVHNDSVTRLIKYGLNDDARIVDSYTIAAANVCDETLSGANAPPSGSQPRYRSDIEFSTGELRRDIIEDILATMAGTHVCVHGQHRVYAGAYTSPVHSFTEQDLYGQLEVEDTLDHGRRFNQVAGVFRDASKQYVEQTTIFRTDSAYETQDGGKAIPVEIDLRGVTDQYQAQRLAEIKLRKSRMMRTIKLVGALNLMKVAPFETISYSHSRYTWSGRIFRCMEKQLDFNEEAGRVTLTCQREDSAVYADLETADYTTGTSASDAFVNETPDPPTNLRSTGIQNAVIWDWDKAAVTYPGTSYELRISTASSMTSPSTPYAGNDLQYVLHRTTTADVFAQVRSIRNGQASAWHPATNGVLGKASSIANALSAVGSPGSFGVSPPTGTANQTTNSVTITPSGGTPGYTYAWTWASGGTGLSFDSASAATTTISGTGFTSGETRSGVARCTVTDSAGSPATYAIEFPVSVTRPAPTITVPSVALSGNSTSPADASVAFRIDADGHWYSSQTTASPAADRGLWCDPPEYAADFEVQITRTGGSETVFTSGPALGSYHVLSTDREWRLTDSSLGGGVKSIIFTIDIRLTVGPGTPVTRTGNSCEAQEQTGS